MYQLDMFADIKIDWAQWLVDNHPYFHKNMVWTNADSYPNLRDERLELTRWDSQERQYPDRPVLMRGTTTARIMAHSQSSPECANLYIQEVVRRYVRRYKYTESNPAKAFMMRSALVQRLADRYWTTYHVREISHGLTFKDGLAYHGKHQTDYYR